MTVITLEILLICFFEIDLQKILYNVILYVLYDIVQRALNGRAVPLASLT